MRSYYTEGDEKILEAVETFEACRDLAFKILKRMPQPVGMVSGPITTGGFGDRGKNMKRFQSVIDKLVSYGFILFDQTPFEDPFVRVMATPYYKGPDHLLEAFYLPIFRSGFVKMLYFMPGWESSYGATWEHKQAEKLGIQIVYLEPHF